MPQTTICQLELNPNSNMKDNACLMIDGLWLILKKLSPPRQKDHNNVMILLILILILNCVRWQPVIQKILKVIKHISKWSMKMSQNNKENTSEINAMANMMQKKITLEGIKISVVSLSYRVSETFSCNPYWRKKRESRKHL